MGERPHVDERSAEQIERDIAATRESITETVEEIEARLRRATDWRTYVERYPWVVLGVAAGIGVFVGRALAERYVPGPRRRPRLPYPPAPEI